MRSPLPLFSNSLPPVVCGAALAVLPQAAHLLSQHYAAEAAPALRQPMLLYEASPRLVIATFGQPVAGSRESKEPGVGAFTARVLREALAGPHDAAANESSKTAVSYRKSAKTKGRL